MILPPPMGKSGAAIDKRGASQPDLSLLLFDFSDPSAVAQWAPLDDRVMAGISRSRLCHDAAGHAVFEGVASMDRNGGFCSGPVNAIGGLNLL